MALVLRFILQDGTVFTSRYFRSEGTRPHSNAACIPVTGIVCFMLEKDHTKLLRDWLLG